MADDADRHQAGRTAHHNSTSPLSGDSATSLARESRTNEDNEVQRRKCCSWVTVIERTCAAHTRAVIRQRWPARGGPAWPSPVTCPAEPREEGIRDCGPGAQERRTERVATRRRLSGSPTECALGELFLRAACPFAVLRAYDQRGVEFPEARQAAVHSYTPPALVRQRVSCRSWRCHGRRLNIVIFRCTGCIFFLHCA